MNANRMLTATVLSGLLLICATAEATDVNFSGFTWTIRPNGLGGRGPNNWRESNVYVDANGYLHLKITKGKHKWYCAQVYTTLDLPAPTGRFGCDRYQCPARR